MNGNGVRFSRGFAGCRTQWLEHLLLSGAMDAKFTQIARQMAAQLPLGWVRVFEGSGHAPHLEVPEAYAVEVLAFLETPWFDAQCAPSDELEERR